MDTLFWLTHKDMYISGLCGQCMQSKGPTKNDGWKGRMARERILNPYYQQNLMMMMMIMHYIINKDVDKWSEHVVKVGVTQMDKRWNMKTNLVEVFIYL